MITILIYLIISCNSTSNYNLDISGVKLDAFTKRGNYIDSIDNRINDRIDYYMQKSEEEKIKEEIKNGEVRNMDSGIQEIVTALSSAIAGIYCLVKTIINIVKKLKKN
nr:MAG TPA: hypothetical protein [Microviridae sp.]